MSRIEILPDHLVSQIAAGEVVERPGSVVKELIENSLDAGARHIDLELEAGGKRRIRVRDDGRGMERDDALRSFDRHATSKIASFEDLESVATLGFRGEALASIAAVAKVELITSAAVGEGFEVRIEGGRIRRAEPTAAPLGTTIDVRSLFYNVPARRAFLKAPRTELQRSMEVIQGYAMARPDVGLTARHEDRILLEAPARGEGSDALGERLQSLFGTTFVANLAPIVPTAEAEIRIWGFVGGLQTARSRRRFVFVNRRLVRDRTLMATFYRAVRDEWRGEDFPALFLFIDLPGAFVDVNVHPQKAEVRFRERTVFDLLYSSLRSALADARGEEAIRPVAPASLPTVPLAWSGTPAPLPPEQASEWRFDSVVQEPTGADSLHRLPQATFHPAAPRPVPLSGRSGEQRAFRLLGQYKGTVLLMEGPDGLYLIDQHVAHERVLFERIRRNLADDTPQSQRLLEPHLMELSRAEVLRLEPMLEGLEQCGIVATPVSETTVAISDLPIEMKIEQVEAALHHLLADSAAPPSTADLRRRLIEDAAASMSCRAAVKMHDPMSPEEMQALVSDLFDAEQPYTCPHGRPVFLKLTDEALELAYKRR